VKAPLPYEYDWTGFYVGGHTGLALGNSNFTANAATPGAPSVFGSLDMYRSPNAFYESGSWLMGVQGGYNYMLQNRVVLGVEADATFPTFQDLSGLSTGAVSPTLRRRRSARSPIARPCWDRHGARAHRLRAGQRAVLRDRRLCLDL
jgi:hypothetical protein